MNREQFDKAILAVGIGIITVGLLFATNMSDTAKNRRAYEQHIAQLRYELDAAHMQLDQWEYAKGGDIQATEHTYEHAEDQWVVQSLWIFDSRQAAEDFLQAAAPLIEEDTDAYPR